MTLVGCTTGVSKAWPRTGEKHTDTTARQPTLAMPTDSSTQPLCT